jgi:hypothetical protein
MADHELITAQLGILADRLPAPAVAELADGLQETYEARLAELHDPDAAARAAIAEFGDADTVTAAFFRESPWRRMAMTLLATGPFMGVLWGSVLLYGRVWDWPIPPAVWIVFGTVLVAIVLTLRGVTREQRAYRRTRTSTLAAAIGLITLDSGMLMITMLPPVPSTASLPLLLAVPASLARIIVTLRALPLALTC